MDKRAFYGFIANGTTNALVAPDGSVEWMCFPWADSGSVFGKLLDPRAGEWRIEAPLGVRGVQRYVDDTGVLVTDFSTVGGALLFSVTDFMPWGGTRLIRLIEPASAAAPASVIRLNPAFDFARRRHDILPEGTAMGWTAVRIRPDGGSAMILHSTIPLKEDSGQVVSEWNGRGPAAFILEFDQDAPPPLSPPLSYVEKERDGEIRFWRGWLKAKPYSGPHADLYRRSLIVLKQLFIERTGAILAAGTMGVPYRLGTGLSWDYRLSWVRDGSFAAEALIEAGAYEEGRRFLEFLFRAQAEPPAKPWRPLYDIRGGDHLAEVKLDHLEGYLGDRPVFAGNAAGGQKQLDAEGAALCLLWRYVTRAKDTCFARRWSDRWMEAADWTASHWRDDDNSLWELRGMTDRFTHSRALCWAALDRAARLADRIEEGKCAARWKRRADQVRADVLKNGWNRRAGFFSLAYDTPILDATAFPLALVGLVDANDPRFTATMNAAERQIVFDGLTSINFIQPAVFPLTTFWRARCLALRGEREKAMAVVDRCAGLSTSLGLFQEHFFTADETPGVNSAYYRDRVRETLRALNGPAQGLKMASNILLYQLYHNPPLKRKAYRPSPSADEGAEFKKPYGNFPQSYSHEGLVMTLKLLESPERVEAEKALFADR